MFSIIYKPEAIEDIHQAAEWYESQQEGLSEKFFDELDELICYLEINPFLSRKQFGNIHQAPMKRFPYVVLFRVESKQVFIFSVFKVRRIQKRLRKESINIL